MDLTQYPYALYLDSKIPGTAKQLVEFYESGVFSTSNTIIYLKKYPQSYKIYRRIFSKANIPFCFMRPRELDQLKNQIIFYPFNAQSNCRLVANRNLKHIFITHGESNKVSSVKPIIRIYDHVAMAGRASLERYYNSGLFDEDDYKKRRLILTGNTFINPTGLSKEGSIPVVLYAPTWEGGLSCENYSSLDYRELVFENIKAQLDRLKTSNVLLMAHPNLGFRDSHYIKRLIELILKLRQNHITVYIKNNLQLSNWLKLKLKRKKINFINNLEYFKALHALVDISAMESKCINEEIPYHIFYQPEMLRVDLPQFYKIWYKNIGISLLDQYKTLDALNYDWEKIKQAIFGYDEDLFNPSLARSKRVNVLRNFM